MKSPVHTQVKRPTSTTAVVNDFALRNESELQPDMLSIPGRPLPFNGFSIQPKLFVNEPNDEFEKEADDIAEKIVAKPDTISEKVNNVASGNIQRQSATEEIKEEKEAEEEEEKEEEKPVGRIQRKCAECEKEDEEENKLQLKPISENGSRNNLPNTKKPGKSLESSLKTSLLNGGFTMDKHTLTSMSTRFGYDFGKVRIHTGSDAIRMSQDLGAKAFTIGSDIYFNTSQYKPQTVSGKRLLAHELTHVIQQRFVSPRYIQRQPVTQAQLNQLCYNPTQRPPGPPASRPEDHPTYAGWIGSFTGLTTFRSNDTVIGTTVGGFNVLGTRGSRYGDTSATAETEATPTTGRPRSGEEFIDHPTNQWVQNCLPANLRATAYQLPADCADIAVILRHVWLSAHHRTETYNGWTVGDAAGRANQARAGRLITDVSSGNVRNMVNPYTNTQGTPLTNFTVLQNLLHVGDILVWEHRKIVRNGRRVSARRTGGHTQTINQIIRDSSNNITDIRVLQGNQPIGGVGASAILTAQGARNTASDSPAAMVLRHRPGRRIEASHAIGVEVNQSTGVGIRVGNFEDPVTQTATWGRFDNATNTEFTVLVVAGPPRSANRPSAASRRAGRQITDWRSRINSANAASLMGVLEALLQEARSIIEQRSAATNPVSASDINTLGRLCGSRLNAVLNRNANLLMQRVQEVVTVIRALAADTTNSAVTGPLFRSFEENFVETALPNSTVEERRLFREHATLINFTSPFASQIAAFSTALPAARNLAAARTVAEQHGTQLWQAATARAQSASGSNDDRPLYWTRLRMIETIRQSRMAFRITQADREQLIRLFESSSRGIPSAGASAFGTSTAQKRILISGFDPFGLNSNVDDSNPSGATVLALDGQTISGNNITAQIEGVIFPVRYRDFDQKIIESFFGPYITGTHPVNMIMTISQGGPDTFDIEESAGRRRSTDTLADNEGVFSGGSPKNPIEPPGIASGPEFLHTRLPHKAMKRVAGVQLNTTGQRQNKAGQSISGTGGGFLSNEIFYRTRLLQTNTPGAPPIPMGHLHVPSNLSRQAIITRVRQILQAALASI